MQQQSNLNLARKWRSKNFEQIVGQDLVVRILKNSLYIDQFFPVYLFSGQRGCGKTSTARIFACALNCQRLYEFQKDPKIVFPCDLCESCIAMKGNKHPDFIEMDAASHTGVDNVRNIIEASTLMPVLGRKKIYLIDEAHMLSKAAFNAFLKVLEEPPSSVVFILATTDVEKIIDTVKSRCFQLIFSSIDKRSLVDHLAQICDKEKIGFDRDGLALIASVSEGSARDAINLMEQVRFSSEKVTKIDVQRVLGHIDDQQVFRIFEILLTLDRATLLKYLSEINFIDLSAKFIWDQILKLLRVSLYLKHDVEVETNFDIEELKSLLSSIKIDKIISLLDLFCENEQVFVKTSNKNLFFEVLLLRSVEASQDFNESEKKSSKLNSSKNMVNVVNNFADIKVAQDDDKLTPWQKFLQRVQSLDDPVVLSVFKQANFVKVDLDKNKLVISFYNNYVFLTSLLEDTKKLWMPFIKEIFEVDDIESQVIKSDELLSSSVVKSDSREMIKQEDMPNRERVVVRNNVKCKLDIDDKDKWKLANMLLEAFPGEIIEVKESE
jgi:DNA polymerase III subunit gamma/tau